MKNKMIIVTILYITALIIQYLYFVPYTMEEIYISEQNVPHTITLRKGYTSFENATYTEKFNDKDKLSRILAINVDYPRAYFQFTVTTILAGAVFLYFLKTEKNNTDNY